MERGRVSLSGETKGENEMPSSKNAVVLTEDEKDLIDVFRQLNRNDKRKAIVYAEELAGIWPPMLSAPKKPLVLLKLGEEIVNGYIYSYWICTEKV